MIMPTNFAEKIYFQLKKVPKGKVTTYKELAKIINSKAYRAVGNALRCNPFAPKVPCHRAVSSDGGIGGFKGFKSGRTIDEKIDMLRNEGVLVERGKIKDFETILYKFLPE